MNLICIYCGDIRKNKNSLAQHQRLCSNNPNRDKYNLVNRVKVSNQFLKAKELGLPKPETSKESIQKCLATKLTNDTLKFSAERKKNMSRAMKRAVLDNPDSYSSGNRGRAKHIEKYGIKFIGNWELEFYEYCLQHNITIERCLEWFCYSWNGERKYNPDFFLKDYNVYIEIKGYETERDHAKWESFPHKLIKIKLKEIESIRNGTFNTALLA